MDKKVDLKEFAKKHYIESSDFDNLQFVKDCKEEGVKEYKKKVKAFVDRVYPEKPIKCFAQAMSDGRSQVERREALKELELKDD